MGPKSSANSKKKNGKEASGDKHLTGESLLRADVGTQGPLEPLVRFVGPGEVNVGRDGWRG